VTLPERTLRQLRSVDTDLARAIVKATEAMVRDAVPGEGPVELLPVDSGAALIVVSPMRCLRRVPAVRLVEVTPGRHLIAIAPGTPVESLEVALVDLLENLPREEEHERAAVLRLLDIVRRWRRLGRVAKSELLLVPSEAG
jgi:hypothetical protein